MPHLTSPLLTGRLRFIDNPLNGVLPDFAIFGDQFTELWQKLLAGIWGLAIVVAIVYLIIGLLSMGKADSTNPQAYKAGRGQFVWALVALGGLAALAVVVGAILALVG